MSLLTRALTTPPLSTPPLIGVLLAGGQSRRMGTDKALLSLHGQTWLDRAWNLLEQAGCQQRWVSGFDRPGSAHTPLPDFWPDAGPVGGILSSLRHLTQLGMTQAICLFLPIDMPQLNEPLLRRLLPSNSDITAAYFADHPLPFGFRLSPQTLPLLHMQAELLGQGHNLSIRRFLTPFDPQILQATAAETTCLSNINDPAAWQKIQQHLTTP